MILDCPDVLSHSMALLRPTFFQRPAHHPIQPHEVLLLQKPVPFRFCFPSVPITRWLTIRLKTWVSRLFLFLELPASFRTLTQILDNVQLFTPTPASCRFFSKLWRLGISFLSHLTSYRAHGYQLHSNGSRCRSSSIIGDPPPVRHHSMALCRQAFSCHQRPSSVSPQLPCKQEYF